MPLTLAFSVCFLAASSQGVTQQESTRQIAPIEFQAECTLTPELVDQILLDLQSDDKSDAASALLAEHEVEHGWGYWIGDQDFIDSAHAVRCSDSVLEKMAALPGKRADVYEWRPHFYFAKALERNGRLDQALSMLDAALSEPLEQTPGIRTALCHSMLASFGARLCERHQRWERALLYSKQWTPTSDCSFSLPMEIDEIATFQVRMLIQLHRYDEAIAVIASASQESLDSPDHEQIALWIDCEIAGGHCANATSALEIIRPQVHSKDADAGKRLWELRHCSRTVQLDNLSELAGLDEGLAVSLTFGFDNPIVVEHLDALDIVDGTLRDWALSNVLAETGNPRLQLAVERAEKAHCGDIESVRVRWDDAHRRWVALSHKR